MPVRIRPMLFFTERDRLARMSARARALLVAALTLACTSGSPSSSDAAKPSTPSKVDPSKLDPATTPPTPVAVQPAVVAPAQVPTSQVAALPYYWVGREGNALELDAHDLSPTESAAFETLEFDDVLELARGDARIPARFAHDQRFVLFSEAGRVEATVEGVHLEMGADISMVARLRADAPLAAEHGMLAFVPERAPSKLAPRLPERLAASDAIVGTVVGEVAAAAKQQGVREASASELEVDRVALRGEPGFVVAIEFVPGDDDEEPPPTGFALADAKGKIVEWVAPLGSEPELYEVALVFDLEGDGNEELLYLARYHEGAFWHQLSGQPSDAGSFTLLEIAGSGL